MRQVYMLIGIPGSGKSYEAGRLMKESKCVYVCPDEIRKELYGDISVQGDPRKVFEKADSMVKEALKKGLDVIFDATNTFRRSNTIEKFRNMGSESVTGIYLDAPIELCIKRNASRGDRKTPVPLDVIRRMHKNLNEFPPTLKDGFDELRVIKAA